MAIETDLLFAVIERKLPYSPDDPGVVTWTGFPTAEAEVALRRLGDEPFTRIICTTPDESFAQIAWAISVNPEASALAKRDELIGDGLAEEIAIEHSSSILDFLRRTKLETARELLASTLR